MSYKTRIISVFVLLSLCCSTGLLAQWVEVETGTDYDINSIAKFDNYRLVCVTGGGAVLISDDNGESWTEKYGTYESLTHVDAKVSTAIAVSDYGQILRSADYGESWEELENLYTRMRGAAIYSGQKAYVCGDDELMFESNEYLTSWNPIPWIMGNGYWLRDICFSDDLNGYVVGDGGTAFKTPNAGYGWFKMDTKTELHLKSVSFPSIDTGYICGHSSTLLKTTDGGISWNNMISMNYADFRGALFLSTSEGYVCGTDGVILHTSDGGFTWEQEQSGVTKDLNEFCYMDSTHRLFLAGKEGILLYKDLNTSIDEMPSKDDYSQISVFPNPAKNNIIFQNMDKSGIPLILIIYSPKGSKVATHKWSNTAVNLKLEITDFTPGIYHYRLYDQNDEIQSGSFVKQ